MGHNVAEMLKRWSIWGVLSVAIASLGFGVATFDWGLLGLASVPTAPRNLPSSESKLTIVTMDGKEIDDSSIQGFCAGSSLIVQGTLQLAHLNFGWSTKKKPRSFQELKRRSSLPRVALQLSLQRWASTDTGFVTEAVGFSEVLEHKDSKAEWTSRLRIPARKGTYRLAIDFLEIDGFHSIYEPLKRSCLLEAQIQVQRCQSAD